MLCAIYCRLSKEDEDKQRPESESIQNQKSMLVRYAVEHHWEIYNLYCDEDYSGADADRPDFNRMLADAQAKRFQIILCKTQSRFTRDMELVEKYIHGKFLLWGIRFVAIADNVDTDMKGNKKARQINGLINEWYLEDLSENIRMVFDDKRRQGQYIGGSPLFGYRKDPRDKNKLLIDEDAAAIVRQIFRWYLEGNGTQRIAQMLNERGYENPTQYKEHLKQTSGYEGLQNHLGLWNKTTVSRILHNEMYTGVMVQGRKKKASYKLKQTIDVPEEQWYRVPGTHEAIVDSKTFAQVQELMRPRVKTDGLGEVHVLSGLVQCMDCGSTMQRTSNRRRDGESISYLRCKHSAARSDQALCTRHSIRLDRLIQLVSECLREHIRLYYQPVNLNQFQDAAESQSRKMSIQKELDVLEREIEKRAAALKTLYLDRTTHLIGEEQFRSMNEDFLKEKEELTRRKLNLVEERNCAACKNCDGTDLEQRIWELLMSDPVPRELFVLMIERIEVGEKNPRDGTQAIHIVWKF